MSLAIGRVFSMQSRMVPAWNKTGLNSVTIIEGFIFRIQS
jgi:hypothetical protein